MTRLSFDHFFFKINQLQLKPASVRFGFYVSDVSDADLS